ncbi:LacI family transcriptional regulator [Clostridiales bacterium COT073_COT-073]|nr:LacI family transcriptional regulator [Clostridiales bacterium COT073_COT-073]
MRKNNIIKNKAPVTINDISKKLNISSASVHRALAGKEGVSDKLRKKIIQASKEMGYQVNYAAASIKRKAMKIIAILPEDKGLYFDYMWQGIRSRIKEVSGLNIELEEVVCHDERHQYELLKEVARDKETEYQGMITFSYTRDPNVLLQLQRIVSSKVTTVLIDDKIDAIEGMYCLPSNEKAIGRVAAELTGLISPDMGTVLVTGGRPGSKIHFNKVNSFREYLSEQKPFLKVKIVEGYSNKPETDQPVYEKIKNALIENKDTVVFYALTAQDNKLIVKAVKDLGLIEKIAIIGTDFNDSTAEFLKAGYLKAIINQASFLKGYTSVGILVDANIKRIKFSQEFDCPIDIVLQNNLCAYKKLNQY